MERKIGLSSVAARSNASFPQGNHSTGLSACWRRQGLVSSARWFTDLDATAPRRGSPPATRAHPWVGRVGRLLGVDRPSVDEEGAPW